MGQRGADIWSSEAEAELLAGRAEGFWNIDYFDRIILPVLNLPQGARVLDVGAGNGALAFLLAQRRSDLELTAVDTAATLIDAGAAEAARRGANVTFRVGDAAALEFDDGSFDAVVCQTLLIHVPDASLVIREMARVLRPGGTFLAAEFHILNLEGPFHSPSAPTVTLGQSARLAHLLVDGYQRSGQGDLRIGGRVPLLAAGAGLRVITCRINDRVTYGFPPFLEASEQTSLSEARTWVNLFRDPGSRAWVADSIRAAGGTAADIDEFLRLISPAAQEQFARGDTPFVWLINPVLVVTIARKEERTRT